MYLLGFVLGTVLGSLVKALADRSLTGRSFLGRSYCPHCQHQLRWYDLLPIVSYLILRGKCRYCGDRISLEYLLVEVGMGVVVGFLFWQATQNFQFQILNFKSILNFKFLIFTSNLLFKAFFISVLAVLFLTDIKKMLIPDRIILPSIVISVIFLIFVTIIKIGYLYYYLTQTLLGQKLLQNTDYFPRHAAVTAEPLLGSVLSALLLGGFFWALILITRGKGMGGGDVKLGALMGLGLGFPNSALATVLAFLIGAVFSLGLIVLGKKHFGQTIPFGPFLVIGSLIALLWGKQIIDWYLKLSL